ncbi:MAG TPA: YkgJ family cysteine cluster protein [Methanothrix sp.]|nr:YkgJ family cysteine cluster protein [Methanothrix sp.]
MDEALRATRITRLKRDLAQAKGLSAARLASEIIEIGFVCLRCGDCCQGTDNSVLAFPREIRRIEEATGLSWLQIAGPPEEGEFDSNGCFHTLEWRLLKDEQSCRFYREGCCKVYQVRPGLCRTYPFYLDCSRLFHSECRGLGGRIEPEKAKKIAEYLILRHITEIEEAISLLERYRDFERGDPEEGHEKDCIIVHDSEGEHIIRKGANCSGRNEFGQ